MNFQYIQDGKGNATGVFIPIEEWQSLKDRYTGIEAEEITEIAELSQWQRDILDERLNDYHQNEESLDDFGSMIQAIENSL